MSGLPADICNQALDAIGSAASLGDIADGSREASVLLRAYGQCLRQLLRSANWNFATTTNPLTLLADATGQTLNVGSVVPQGFIYEYAYPTDCVRAQSVVWSALASQAQVIPISSAYAAQGASNPIRRARFLLANDSNYPPQAGNTWDIAGLSPAGRLVILTNAPNAQMRYTRFTPYPSMWDSLFRGAFVAFLAAEVALPLSSDKKFGLAIRRDQLAIAKSKVMEARIADGNEQPMSSDIGVDWMQARNSGGHRHPRIGGEADSGYNHDLWNSQFQGSFSTDFSSDFA